MRIVFMGTPAFAVPSLNLLVQRGFDIRAVVTQPDRPVGRSGRLSPSAVKQAALLAGLAVHQPQSLKTPDAISFLRSLSPDAIVVVAYGQILRRSVLDLPPLGCVNVHPSLLPKLRGAAPLQAAIREGLHETGVTIMLMNERMDAGPVLAQARFPILPTDTAAALGDRLSVAGAHMLVDTLDRLERGLIIPMPQDEAAATYCTPLRKEDADIDWSRSAEEIARSCRAQTPWPGCQSYWDGRQVRLLAVDPEPSWTGPERPGTVLNLARGDRNIPVIAVATGRGALIVNELQLAGKRPLSTPEFVRGQPGLVGTVLQPKPA